MPDAIEDFFHGLAERGYEPLLRQFSGTLSCEVVDGGGVECWQIIIRRGTVAVARDGHSADCVVRADRPVFRRLLTGQLNAQVALLRGEVFIEGNTELVTAVERILPGPAGAPAEPGTPTRHGG